LNKEWSRDRRSGGVEWLQSRPVVQVAVEEIVAMTIMSKSNGDHEQAAAVDSIDLSGYSDAQELERQWTGTD
jgi:hypothetical protein